MWVLWAELCLSKFICSNSNAQRVRIALPFQNTLEMNSNYPECWTEKNKKSQSFWVRTGVGEGREICSEEHLVTISAVYLGEEEQVATHVYVDLQLNHKIFYSKSEFWT